MKPYKIIKFDNKLEWEVYLKKTNSTMLESSYNFCNIFKKYLINTEPEIYFFENNNSQCTYTYLKSKTLIGNCYHIHSPYWCCCMGSCETFPVRSYERTIVIKADPHGR